MLDEKNKKPVLSDKDKARVVVQVYKNGNSIPLCRYATDDSHGITRCVATLNNTSLSYADMAPECPYS